MMALSSGSDGSPLLIYADQLADALRGDAEVNELDQQELLVTSILALELLKLPYSPQTIRHAEQIAKGLLGLMAIHAGDTC